MVRHLGNWLPKGLIRWGSWRGCGGALLFALSGGPTACLWEERRVVGGFSRAKCPERRPWRSACGLRRGPHGCGLVKVTWVIVQPDLWILGARDNKSHGGSPNICWHWWWIRNIREKVKGRLQFSLNPPVPAWGWYRSGKCVDVRSRFLTLHTTYRTSH